MQPVSSLSSDSEGGPMRANSNKYLAILAFSLFLAPVCAAHTDSASWEPTQPTIVGDAQVKPGNYLLKADEDDHEIRILQNGKTIITVMCSWEDLPKKGADTEIKVNHEEVIEVQFKGRPEAVVFYQ